MTSKREKQPSAGAIARANSALLATLDIDASEALVTCWACRLGDSKGPCTLARAHVMPASAGGPSTPDNFFLLCYTCHREQPDNAPREQQEAWLRGRPHHVDRIFLEMRPAIEAVRAAAGDAEVNAYFEERGRDGILAIFRAGADKSAAANARTAKANAAWNVVADYQEWLRARNGPPKQ